ncbi:hypothetical protein RJT34_07234 [Clitoria ternatea]|uniref:Uncharacterized protein n=1 Tax=Clitoria ternatea TaxID=43366 RepID=A0AAN9PTY0_CLITE
MGPKIESQLTLAQVQQQWVEEEVFMLLKEKVNEKGIGEGVQIGSIVAKAKDVALSGSGKRSTKKKMSKVRKGEARKKQYKKRYIDPIFVEQENYKNLEFNEVEGTFAFPEGHMKKYAYGRTLQC